MGSTRKLPAGTPRGTPGEPDLDDERGPTTTTAVQPTGERTDEIFDEGEPGGTRRLPAGTPRAGREAGGARTRTVSIADLTPLRRKIGRYRVCFEIASGGMASVYLARLEGQRGFEKIVALKCIHDHMARDDNFVEMFLDEARLASQVSHANVCHIFDFGKAEASYYIAMEYLAGETLSAVRRARWARREGSGGPSHRLVTRILADACEGLHAVHELKDARGRDLHVVHRDVTPANLMVTYDGSVKLMDFGIARAKHQSHRTQTGEIRGTIAYMAPEQIRLEQVDRRADVWALGTVGWELLTGHPLFRRESSVKTMYAVLNEPIPRADEVQPSVPAPVADAIARALARDPDARFPTAREFLRALSEAASQDGGLVVSSDVSDWLAELFPGGRERHAELLRFANEIADRPLRSRRRFLAAIAGVGALAAGASLALLGTTGETSSGAPASRPPQPERPAPPASAEAVAEAEPEAVAEAEPEAVAEAEPEAVAEAEPEAPAEAETEAPPRTPRTVRRGRVSISSPDTWAVVYEGGRRLGQTPLQATLTAGRHLLEVRPNDRPPGKRVPVRIQPGRVSRVVVRFDEGTGR